jgi:VWFA-related protein
MPECYLLPARLQTASRFAIFLAALASSAGTATLAQSAQTGSAPPNPAITVNVRLVVLDVAVTDNAGRPVDGLTAKDFQVYEDGRLEQIKSVEPPVAHTLPAAAIAQGLSADFDAAAPAAFGRSPANVLVLDQLNTHFADSSFARNSLRDYLTAQPALLPEPTTLLSISDTGFKTLQPFTRDRDSLLRSLAAAPPEYAWKLEVNGKADYGPIERLDQSLRALEEIAESYARIPGRKNLVWVGGGFPSLDPTTIDRGDAQEVKDALRHVTDVLLDTHVTLYAVDPTSSAGGMTEITDSTQLEFAELAGDALAAGSDPFSSTDDFDRLGPLSGGRVVRARNDVAQQIASAVETGAHFYTIAYAPSSSSTDAAKLRRIRVVCLRPGLTAATRIGYYSGTAHLPDPVTTAAYDLTTAAESPLPLRGLSVSVTRSTAADASASSYIVRAGAAGLTWKPQPDGSATASVYLMAVSLNRKNRMLDHTLQRMTAKAKAGVSLSDPARTADFLITATAPPKATTLRFIVRDSATGSMGSFDLPLAGRGSSSR